MVHAIPPNQSEISWSEVFAIHGSRSGISTRQGRVISLLCNQHKAGEYADEVQPDRIFYRVTSQTQSRGVDALKRMVSSTDHVRVFEKLGVNRWLDHGDWIIENGAPESDGWLFLLTRPA